MPDKIYYELDPVYETMGLLFVSSHFDEIKQDTKKALSDAGLDGERLYSQNFEVFEKYVQSFLEHRIPGPNDELFFGEADSYYFLILSSIIIENRHWIKSMDDSTDEEINMKLIHVCKDVINMENDTEITETFEDRVKFLEDSGLEGNTKWNLMRIMRQPKKHLKELIDVIEANIQSYQRAESAIKKTVIRLLDQYAITIHDQSDKNFFELKNKVLQDTNIFPALIFPVSQMLYENSCYYGLLSQLVIDNGKSRKDSSAALRKKLKALSDNSKLEIIASLKISPKYNLEIARELGLTAATMSHHMSVLLNCGFVDIEKRDGKVYYRLKQETLKDLINELELTLL